MTLDMYPFYTHLMSNGIIISYCGPVAQEGIEGIAVMLKDKLTAHAIPLNSSVSIFSLFIEQMQNVLNYSAERTITAIPGSDNNKEVPNGIFVLGCTADSYFTRCGNIIKNSEIERIEHSICQVNSMNKDELKAFYRQKRRSENDNPESRGAGLGFIEMARRADGPLKYEITPIDDVYSFFTLQTTINKV